MLDSHCHLHGDRMRADSDAAIARARKVGVTGFVLAGVQPSGWRHQVVLAERHPDVELTYGVHPQLVAHLDAAECRDMLSELDDAARGRGYPKPVAIGEIGLDRHTRERKQSDALQAQAFRSQLALARELDLPVMLHILAAHGRALDILRSDGVGAAGGVVHSYSGSAELVREYVELGLHISFSGVVTKPAAKRIRAAAAAVPDRWLMVETDSPDQTPLPHAPRPNEPAYLVEVVAALAELRNTTAAEIAELSERNGRRLFGLDPP